MRIDEHFAEVLTADTGVNLVSDAETFPNQASRLEYWRLATHNAPPIGACYRLVEAGCDGSVLRQLLAEDSINENPDAELSLILTNDYLDARVSAAVAESEVALLARPLGRRIWLGPLFVKSQFPCYRCMAKWLALNRFPQNAFAEAEGVPPPQPATAQLAATVSLASGWIAANVALVLAGATPPELLSHILHFDTANNRVERSRLQFWPGCTVCPQVNPTLEALRSPYTGIMKQVETTSEPVLGFYHSRGLFSQSWPIDAARGFIEPQTAAARGRTPEEASESCVAEAVERYSAVYQGTERIFNARFGDRPDLIHPNELLLVSERQYLQRASWNETADELVKIPEPFDSSQPISWVEAIPLDAGEPVYIPAAYCYFWLPGALQAGYCVADSNGCAGGRSQEDSIIAALCELIERDAVGLWWYNRIPRPETPLAAFRDDRLTTLAQRVAKDGWMPYVLDVTTDFGLPAYVGVFRHQQTGDVTLGSAAHPEPAVAALKALSEAGQVYFWSSRQDNSTLGRWRKTLRELALPQLSANGQTGVASEFCPGGSLDQILSLLVERLAGRNLRPFYVDLTRPEIGIPVVRAIVPGIRHFWPRFAPGRLFDTPVQLGWLETPRTEAELERLPLLL